MKKAIIILENGFEDSEAIVCIDLLRRSGIEVILVGISEYVTSQYNLTLKTDLLLSNINSSLYDCLIIPGGKAVSKLDNNLELEVLIKDFYQQEKLIACICAAPSLVFKHGYPNKYCVYPSFSRGGNEVFCNVIRDGFVITAKSMAYTIEFSFEIIKYLVGNDIYLNVRRAIYGEK